MQRHGRRRHHQPPVAYIAGPVYDEDTQTVALTVSSSDAAVDAFLKIDGIDGQSQAVNYGGWIDLNGVSFGFRRPLSVTSSGVQSAGAPTQDAFVISKILDKSSPPLALKCPARKVMS